MKCICCGCTDEAPCLGQLTPTATCFWTWKDEQGGWGLCSACAGIPFDALMNKVQLTLPVMAQQLAADLP